NHHVVLVATAGLRDRSTARLEAGRHHGDGDDGAAEGALDHVGAAGLALVEDDDGADVGGLGVGRFHGERAGAPLDDADVPLGETGEVLAPAGEGGSGAGGIWTSMAHEQALSRSPTPTAGTRASGTPGYEASVDHKGGGVVGGGARAPPAGWSVGE